MRAGADFRRTALSRLCLRCSFLLGFDLKPSDRDCSDRCDKALTSTRRVLVAGNFFTTIDDQVTAYVGENATPAKHGLQASSAISFVQTDSEMHS
jgi:hypothetical protein